MRKFLTVAAVAVTLLLLAPAQAGHAAVTGGRVAGIGTLGELGEPTAYLAALQTRYGATGAFTITYPDGTYAAGTVTCLVVSGTVAYVTGRIALSGGPRRAAHSWLRGSYLFVGVQDNGTHGTPDHDRLNFSPGFATNPGCGPDASASPDFFVVRGDYRVAAGS
jgi:hypothetical protein